MPPSETPSAPAAVDAIADSRRLRWRAARIVPCSATRDKKSERARAHFGERATIAGMLPNEPRGLVRWLRHPQSVVPANAMPDMGLDERDARDIAACLYTLR